MPSCVSRKKMLLMYGVEKVVRILLINMLSWGIRTYRRMNAARLRIMPKSTWPSRQSSHLNMAGQYGDNRKKTG